MNFEKYSAYWIRLQGDFIYQSIKKILVTKIQFSNSHSDIFLKQFRELISMQLSKYEITGQSPEIFTVRYEIVTANLDCEIVYYTFQYCICTQLIF